MQRVGRSFGCMPVSLSHPSLVLVLETLASANQQDQGIRGKGLDSRKLSCARD